MNGNGSLGFGEQVGLSAATSVLGGIFSAIGDAQRFKNQKKLLEYQYQKNIEQWNRQNEYNSPSAQMDRLRSAGLNPNLVYGNGGATMASADSPQYEAPEAPMNFSEHLGQQLSSRPTQLATELAQIKLLSANRENVESETHINNIEGALKMLQFDRDKYYTSRYSEIFQKNLEKTVSEIVRNETDALVNKSTVEVNGATVRLKDSQVALNKQSERLLKQRTKLTSVQIADIIDSWRERDARINLMHQQGGLYGAQTGLTLENLKFAQDTHADRAGDIYYSKVLKRYDSLIKHETLPDVVNNSHFQSLSAKEQYRILVAYGMRKAKKEVNSTSITDWTGMATVLDQWLKDSMENLDNY